jgi:hypothetical protein
MTRQSLLAAILLSLSATLLADEPSNSVQIHTAPDVVVGDTAEPLELHEQRGTSPSNTQNVPTSDSFPDPFAVASNQFVMFQTEPETETQSCEKCGGSFHCANHITCGIGNLLSCECQCETTCCTTDQWCCNPCQCAVGNCYRTECGEWVCNDGHCDVWGDPQPQFFDPIRFGYWGVSAQGSPTKTGEFQDLNSSPFWDLDTIVSNGTDTLDLTLTGLDNEANNARALYYGPGGKANVKFQRFQRQLDHDPPAGFIATPPGPPNPGPVDDVVTTDLNFGQDYAIRVDQLDAKFSGRVSDNVKWKLNLWGMRKFGERQANSTAHCFNFNAPGAPVPNEVVCHVQSGRQSIDWATMEVQPGLEARVGGVTLEYTRTMRSFGQADEVVNRRYTQFGFTAANNTLGPEFNYAVTPENFTQIDRLKASSQLNESNQLYANLYLGDTRNEFRDMHRQFNGWDLRLTNTARNDLTLTAYSSMNDENNERPSTFFTAPPLAPANGYDAASVRHTVDYQRIRTGLNGRWRPYLEEDNAWRNLSWNGGYEYYIISRDFATYDSARLGIFSQPDTTTHQVELGPSMQWSPELSSYVRYKVALTDVPLIGVRESNGRFNTNQPEQQHWVDLGSTWAPATNWTTTVQFSFVNSSHRSHFARFSENSYPFTVTSWYAPNDRWSFSGAYAYSSSWIDQNIAIGFRTSPFESTPWNYEGQNHLASFNAYYSLTSDVQLTGGYEFDRGTNVFSVPASPTGANWSALPGFSDVVVETQRLTAGTDWQPYRNFDVFFRYILFDFNDISAGVDSGTTHMALAGASIAR